MSLTVERREGVAVECVSFKFWRSRSFSFILPDILNDYVNQNLYPARYPAGHLAGYLVAGYRARHVARYWNKLKQTKTCFLC